MPRISKKKVLEAVEALERVSAAEDVLSKEALLEQYGDNQVLKDLIQMALDGTSYYVQPSTNLISAVSITDFGQAFTRFVKLADRLARQEISGSEAERVTNRYLISVPPPLKKWFGRVLANDIRIGLGEEVLERVYGKGFLSESPKSQQIGWRYLGHAKYRRYEELVKTYKKPIRFPASVEPILPSPRVLVFCFPKRKDVYILDLETMETKSVKIVQEILDSCQRFFDGAATSTHPVVLDGYLGSDDESITLTDWSWLSSYMDTKTFQKPWKQRKRLLKFFQLGKVSVVEQTTVYDDVDLLNAFESYVDKGFSGILVKALSAPLTFKSSDNIVEIAPYHRTSGTVVEAHPGPDGLGHLVVAKGKSFLRVGCGFSVDQRRELWEKKEELPKKKIELLRHRDKKGLVARWNKFLEFRAGDL